MLQPPTRQRPSLKLVIGLGAAVVVGLVIFWLQIGMITSIVSLGAGARSFQTSLTSAVNQIADGNYDGAQSDFVEVESAAERVSASGGGPHMALVGSIPGLRTPVDNWHRLSTSTDNITTSVGGLLTLFGDLSGKSGTGQIFQDGAIDVVRLNELPPRVEAIDNGIASTVAQLASIDATGPAAGFLEKARNRALGEIVPVQDAIDALVRLAPKLPDALGANGVRRYLLAIGNQAEMRAAGGAPLTLVLVEFDNGRISIPIKGQTSTELFPPMNAAVQWWGPTMNPFFSTEPRNAPMVVTNTHPSLLFSAREMAGAWVGGTYPEVDGVITLDLTAIGAALNAIGPIQSETYGTVTGDQLGQILLIDAYQKFGQTEAEQRQIANQQLLDQLITKLMSGDDLVSVAKAVASTAPGRHFQAWMRDDDFEKVIVDSGAGGDVVDPKTGDWSAIYTQNGNQSKVDVFQQRNVVVTVNLAEDGSARVNQQITLTNATPPDRPALGTFGKIGYETMWLKAAYLMYVPDAATNYRVSYPNGFAVRPFKNHQQMGLGFVNDGIGQKLVRVVGWTAPGAQSAVSVSYDLPAGTFAPAASKGLTYTLHADPQSLFTPSTITVRVTAPTGWVPVNEPGMQVTGNTGEVSAVQNGPVDVRMDFRKAA